ncbi:MAG: RES family NAD+ phosphorylase [Deltaproteobacteria bacterium]|nr:RES family NAD+ phosphorylase [Deltaproteobacteria bacterium]
MIVWRLCRKKHSRTPLDGEGAKKYGGRWNHKGLQLVYCSSTLSLCTLEYLVHLQADLMPADLVSISIELPDSISIKNVELKHLPRGWQKYPAPSELQDLGTKWAKSRHSLALRVPSSLIPVEYNYILNPDHAEFTKVIIKETEPFKFDPRLVGKRN